MFSYPSPVIAWLMLVSFVLWFIDFVVLREKALLGLGLIRLVVATPAAALCLIRVMVNPMFMTVWALAGSIYFAALAFFHWRERLVGSRQCLSAQASAASSEPVQSPAARLDEIHGQIDRLLAEKRELEQRPDANRL